jgi:hypothetical protein
MQMKRVMRQTYAALGTILSIVTCPLGSLGVEAIEESDLEDPAELSAQCQLNARATAAGFASGRP